MARVMIIGGHGKIALLAAPLLVQDGNEVTSVIRNPDQSDEVEQTGARARVADIETLDADGFDELLAGQDVVVWSAGAGGGDPDRTYAVDRDAATASMDAAARQGVDQYVIVSYFGAGPNHGVPQDNPFWHYAEAKTAADEHLRGSDLTWTILQPSKLTSGEATGTIDADADEADEVARADVARVIAETVRAGAALGGQTVRFNAGSTPIAEALAAHQG